MAGLGKAARQNSILFQFLTRLKVYLNYFSKNSLQSHHSRHHKSCIFYKKREGGLTDWAADTDCEPSLTGAAAQKYCYDLRYLSFSPISSFPPFH